MMKKGKESNGIEYIAKYWLFKDKYLAVLSNALVIVSVDKDGNPIRYAIFKKD